MGASRLGSGLGSELGVGLVGSGSGSGLELGLGHWRVKADVHGMCGGGDCLLAVTGLGAGLR